MAVVLGSEFLYMEVLQIVTCLLLDSTVETGSDPGGDGSACCPSRTSCSRLSRIWAQPDTVHERRNGLATETGL